MQFSYKTIIICYAFTLPFVFPLGVTDNFKYASSEYEHTAGYDATCTAICMTRMMAYIGIES